MTEVNGELSSSPGRILRAAREELGYSIDYVADALHLRSSVVESMEKEELDAFSSEVFLKGYFRSYCRLVNLHESRMIELLEKQLSDKRSHQHNLEQEALEAKNARRNSKLAVIGAAVLFVAAIAYSILTAMSDVATEAQEDVVIQPVQDVQVVSDAIPTKDIESETINSQDQRSDVRDGDVPKNDSATDVKAIINSSAEVVVQPEAIDTVLPASSEIEGGEKQVSDVENISEPFASDPKAPITPSVQAEDSLLEASSEASDSDDVSTVSSNAIGTFKATFDGDCWFTLKNGSGKTVIAALKKAGTEASYEGQLPFNVVFGNANVAKAEFNGETLDLSPHTRRNGRAEVNLGLE